MRTERAFFQWLENHPLPTGVSTAHSAASRLQWAKDAFFEAYLAGFEHAADAAKTAMREIHDDIAPVAVNHNIPT